MPVVRITAAALALACVLAGVPVRAQSAARPEDAAFQLLTVAQDRSTYPAVGLGTAFFVDAAGVALTNSHVVYLARQNPKRYRLLAIVGREFYSAAIVCANPLPYDPDKDPAILGRDIAEVKIGVSRFPFTTYLLGETEFVAHLTRLRPFRALALGRDPAPGTAVSIVGYGIIQEVLSPKAGARWTATGSVDRVAAAPDGTPVFRVASTNRPRDGNSGSPVLDRTGRVAGMWTWNEDDNLAFGVAIASSALARPCGG